MIDREHFDAAFKTGDTETIAFVDKVKTNHSIRTICAFANTKGGILYVGTHIDRKGAMFLGEHIEAVENFQKNLRQHFSDPLPEIEIEPVSDVSGSDGPIIAVHVQESSGSVPVSLTDGTSWRRVGPKNEQIVPPAQQSGAVTVGNAGSIVGRGAKVEPQVGQGAVKGEGAKREEEPKEPSPEKSYQLGTLYDFRREASAAEVALDVIGYAEVIAELLWTADDEEEMSIAIFGHWGRGKTFLANRVTDRLTDPYLVDKGRYKTVLFSAWKYRATPEVWAYLFQRFLEEGKKNSFLLPLRAALYRYGPWPLIWSMFGLFFALWTMGEKAHLLSSVVQAVGIGTVAYGVFLYVRFRSLAVRLKSLYTFAGHAEELGLQAAIGEDLRALLKACCPRKEVRDNANTLTSQNSFWERWSPRLKWSYPAFVIAALLITWKLWPVKDESIYTVPLLGEITATVHPYVALIPFILWCVTWVVVPPLILFFPKASRKRILLIVDDLDRCEPKQMLEIIESTMLILDDPEVRKRLQVCMLIDETAFNHALVHKYQHLLSQKRFDPKYQYSVDRIIRENLERFFLVHLRLAPLTDEEITSVAKQYVDHMRPVEVIKDQSTDESADVGRAAAWEPSDTKADDRDDHIEWEPLSNSILQPEEADTILEAVRKHFDGKEREDVGPRTIRCLLFRYQLARDILKKLGETPNPEKLADTVVSHYAGIFDEKSTGDLIQSVVQQVSYTRAGQVKKSFWPEGLHS